MTKADVVNRHLKIFNEALIHQDLIALEEIYAEEYILVRPDGSVITRDAILNDLRDGDLRFHSIDVLNHDVRIHDSIGIFTGEGRAVSFRRGLKSDSHFRFIAIYLETNESLKLIHYQSTSLPH